MHIQVNGAPLYAYTGGKAFDPAKPTVVFVHGVLNDHSVWILQSRYLANHGWNVLAIDLPGHGRSGGEPPATVESAADTVLALLAAVGVEQAALVGHSFGSLIALEAASRAPAHVSHLVMVGTAVTVDAVDGEGKFLGGLILPGHGIMLRALESGTAGLHVPTGEVRSFPTNTSDALTSGGTFAIAGACASTAASSRAA